MMSVSLGGASQALYHKVLCSDHWVAIEGFILDLEHNYIADISDDIYDGQVNVDTTADTSRGLSIKILDPTGSYGLDSSNPTNGALYYDRMIRINYIISSPSLPKPISCAIFTGPMSKMSRDGVFLNVECVGKEIMLQGQNYHSHTYKKGRTRSSIIKDILSDNGETNYDLGNYKALKRGIRKDFSLGRESEPWSKLRSLASGMGLRFFYDGRGVLRLRYKRTASVFTFKSGDKGSLLADPQIDYDDGDIANTFWFVGGKPKHSKHKVTAVYHLPASHPLSSRSLGRRGKHRYLLVKIEDGDVKSKKRAYSHARNEGRKHLNQSVKVTATTLVIPHLEPYDWVTVQNDSFSAKLMLQQFTIPLTVEGDATIGINRNAQKKRFKGRPRPNKRVKIK